ncbi:NADH dehydrogenase [ubiquinone] 1 alpha subcomplex subunit 3 [Thalassophryne amazonica]|uniref:NADH dehydrogenase [ubiquinone] 1 alpha subcomplex subunit 3 n=1 Tax=Thalassophryne amazonica TaxID=390379 RepID=UPI001471993B|nr:NADH dehydrogenase [ubiquinone] 1 alpha subcomplex subunit 3 [Thalassophryne amazonica]
MSRVVNFLKDTWGKEPVIVSSFVIAGIGLVLPLISPWTKYAGMINRATPYNYPVPVRDDGNMPDVPSHPCEMKGDRLEWFKNF